MKQNEQLIQQLVKQQQYKGPYPQQQQYSQLMQQNIYSLAQNQLINQQKLQKLSKQNQQYIPINNNKVGLQQKSMILKKPQQQNLFQNQVKQILNLQTIPQKSISQQNQNQGYPFLLMQQLNQNIDINNLNRQHSLKVQMEQNKKQIKQQNSMQEKKKAITLRDISPNYRQQQTIYEYDSIMLSQKRNTQDQLAQLQHYEQVLCSKEVSLQDFQQFEKMLNEDTDLKYLQSLFPYKYGQHQSQQHSISNNLSLIKIQNNLDLNNLPSQNLSLSLQNTDMSHDSLNKQQHQKQLSPKIVKSNDSQEKNASTQIQSNSNMLNESLKKLSFMKKNELDLFVQDESKDMQAYNSFVQEKQAKIQMDEQWILNDGQSSKSQQNNILPNISQSQLTNKLRYQEYTTSRSHHPTVLDKQQLTLPSFTVQELQNLLLLSPNENLLVKIVLVNHKTKYSDVIGFSLLQVRQQPKILNKIYRKMKTFGAIITDFFVYIFQQFDAIEKLRLPLSNSNEAYIYFLRKLGFRHQKTLSKERYAFILFKKDFDEVLRQQQQVRKSLQIC